MFLIAEIPFPTFIPSTVLGLIALLFWYLYNSYTTKKKAQLDEINSVEQSNRIRVIEMRLNELGVTVDTSDLTAEQKYDLLVRLLNSKIRKYLIAAITLISLCILLVFLIYTNHTKNESNVQHLKEDTSKQDGNALPIPTKILNQKIHHFLLGPGANSDCKTLKDAMDLVQDGDTIFAEDGVYDGGTISKGLTIIGKGEINKIRFDLLNVRAKMNLSVQGLTLSGLVIFAKSNVTINNCDILSSGIDMFDGYLDISNSILDGSPKGGFAIFLRSGSAAVSTCKILQWKSGIVIETGTTIEVKSSVINNNETGVQVSPGSTATIKATDLRFNRHVAVETGKVFGSDGKEMFGTLIEENNQYN
ncbi:MAG TPA: right-handed parallel beta-helix repeat-containing protein [Puia sp.]|jgi:hypothetical protein|nr:right-handed parallel beta-helix repeat-containing protein [Puia sp.]